MKNACLLTNRAITTSDDKYNDDDLRTNQLRPQRLLVVGKKIIITDEIIIYILFRHMQININTVYVKIEKTRET